MKGKRTFITLLIAAAVVSVAVFGAGAVIAQNQDGYPPIIQKIAEKFNLDVDEVKEVFDDERQARHEQMREQCEARLNKAVEDGKLTEDQKNELLKIMDKKKDDHAKMKDISPGERHEAMKEHRDELKKWAEDNDIDLTEILGHGHGPGCRPGRRGGHGPGSGPWKHGGRQTSI